MVRYILTACVIACLSSALPATAQPIAKELFGNNGSSNGLPQLPDLQDALPAPDAIEPTLPNVDGGINLMPDLQPLNEKPIGEGLN